MTYRVRVLTDDVKLLPLTSYGNDPVEATPMYSSGKNWIVVSTISRDRFNQWLTALDNAGRIVDVDYEVVTTPP